MKTSELRDNFLGYFGEQGHEVLPSSPLVPGNDPTLLFTNAGMVQFKDVFLGTDPRPYNRAATSQRCVRAGGKHNDLENVGYTARHHTFFEMLGNFSFGDYFKREAIAYAWEFVTKTLGLPPEKLWVTVFRDDDEAADIWHQDIGINPNQFTRLGEKDNFWAMGDTGPCGPCSEIFYDHGPDVAGGPPGSPDEDGDRYVEVWNLVFMQFERGGDGILTPLPKPSVDTGMGLERIAAVMQGVHSNYDIDLFANLVRAAADLTHQQDTSATSLRVIADHIRACAFLIADEVLPSNEGRGYVLRRIIRRAIRHGYMLGVNEPFFYKLVAALEREMGVAYPELGRKRAHVERVLKQEEERFAETLDRGMKILNDSIAGMSGTEIDGQVAFKLYDTYGFPLDLTADIARERDLTVDEAGFENAMSVQRKLAQQASKFGVDYRAGIHTDQHSEFRGYETTSDAGIVTALFKDEKETGSLMPGDTGVVILDQTPFYAESGGQVGDVGTLTVDDLKFVVRDTQKFGKAHGHIGVLEGDGELKVGAGVAARVDAKKRQATVLNHSATHLLHAALRSVLGEHVTQKGSLVAPDRLRFDFSHYEPVSPAQLLEIEKLVNAEIRANADAVTRVMPYDDALQAGALALFGEKYDSEVRVLQLGAFSTELCGGTHVGRVGDIGLFKLTGETGIAAGVRRVEAVTGEGAMDWIRAGEATLAEVGALVKGTREDLGQKVSQLMERGRSLEKEMRALQAKLVGGQGDDLADRAVDVNGIKVVAANVAGVDQKTLRDAVDRLKDKLGKAVVVLSTVEDGKVRLVAGVSKAQTKSLKAGELIGDVAQQVGGRGGGRPDLAQAGGTDPSKLDDALASVADWVRQRTA